MFFSILLMPLKLVKKVTRGLIVKNVAIFHTTERIVRINVYAKRRTVIMLMDVHKPTKQVCH